MAVIKCKMCGGSLQISEDSSVCECEYCGTKQTVPKADDEKKLTLFARAGKLLRGCEFDKAAGVFESIVADFPEEAEAYWGLVLCKYGIEYVDDPATGKKVPTCHRSSFDSVEDDANFEQACENADAIARRVYRDEARQIEGLRKKILEVSGREEPYDVFISYKETDEEGERTPDSVIAQDIYKALTNEGYRVFFSRISLEGKLGVEYEPYIFAALNSAKVLLAVGTDYEYYDAVWVKNEWSRFLKLIAAGQPKTLIPVYKDMDPYDMPKELRGLAAQNMGKLGAMQDLLHGIEKIVGKKKPEPAPIPQSGVNTAALLKRGFMSLEDNQWDKATELFDRVLNDDPENAEAYLGLAMAEAHSRTQNEFRISYIEPFSKLRRNPNVIRAGQFSEELKNWFAQLKAEGEEADKERRAEQERERLAAWQKARDAEKARKRAEEAACIAREKECERLAKERQRLSAGKGMIAAGEFCTVCVSAEGQPFFTGDSRAGQKLVIQSWSEVIAVCAGARHMAALKKDGTIVAAGDRSSGVYELGGWTDIQEIAAGRFHTVGLRRDGTVVAAGRNEEHQCDVGDWSEVVAIAAGGYYTLGLKADGSILKKGDCPLSGKISGEDARVVALSAGAENAGILKADGTVSVRGRGPLLNERANNKIAQWQSIVAIASGSNHIVGLRSDGSVVAAGMDLDGQCEVRSWKNVVAIAAGAYHTVGLCADGTVLSTQPKRENDKRQSNVAEWKLFTDFNNLNAEREAGFKKAEEKRRAAEEERIAQEKRREEEINRIAEERRAAQEKADAARRAEEERREARIRELASTRDDLQARRAELNKEYHKLGLFAGKRKREIEKASRQLLDHLSEIEAELKTLG
jgi:hypothetical protein